MKNLYLPPKIVLHIKFESESKKKKKKDQRVTLRSFM